MPKPLADRIESLDWTHIAADLNVRGSATTGPILTPKECAELAALYDEEAPFRSRVVMARHGFGSGEYKYFSAPLPETVATLREALYPHLAETANCWQAAIGGDLYPTRHADYLQQCHAAGQKRPTPLLLKYEAEDYNCQHQDLYGDLAFPLQATPLLSGP